MNRKSKIIVSVVGITIVLLALLGITYAYYLTRIEGNTNTNSISVTTADLKLVYGDGNGIITVNDIMPGTTIGEKTFTVKNTGKTKIDDYAVSLEYAYIEDIIPSIFERPNDFEITLTCSSKKKDGSTGTCNGYTGKFDNESIIMATNQIDSEEVHTYSLVIYYANPNEDQSNDMGKNLNLKVDIFRLSESTDMNGEITGVDETYSVRLNSEPKTSSIIKTSDNKYIYKFKGVPLGTHTLTVLDEDGEDVTSHKIVVERGNGAGTGTKEITYVEDGETITVTAPAITITKEERVSSITTNVNTSNSTMTSTGGGMTTFNPYEGNKSTLAYNIINNAMTTANGTTFRATPLTIPVIENSERFIGSNPTDYATNTPTSNYYFVYCDTYEITAFGSYRLINPQVFQYTNDLTSLKGKYITSFSGYDSESDANIDTVEGMRHIGDLYYVGEETTATTLSYGEVIKSEESVESTLSITQDNMGNGKSYYYRGSVQDNYVLFNNMCFRIVRIEGDGSVKLIFAGDVTEGATNCNEVGTDTGLLKDSDNNYIIPVYGYDNTYSDGYYYADYENNVGGKAEGNTGLEDTIESWFTSKFTTDALKGKLKKDKWCLGGSNDYIYDVDGNLYTGQELLEFKENNNFYNYSAFNRMFKTETTSLMCENEDYVESKYGTLTSDEVTLAGADNNYNYNQSYYLFENAQGVYYWTLSLAQFYSVYDSALGVGSYGSLQSFTLWGDNFYVNVNSSAVRPSITLKSGTTIMDGVGTKTNPYIISSS